MKLVRVLLTICLVTAGVPLSAQSPDDSANQPTSQSRTGRLSLHLPKAELGLELSNLSKPPVFAVAPVPRAKRRGHPYWGTIAGVAIGAAAGAFTAVAIITSDAQCQPHCGPRKAAAGAALVGFPILGGFIGYAISKAP
jgi:hypothetical protein